MISRLFTVSLALLVVSQGIVLGQAPASPPPAEAKPDAPKSDPFAVPEGNDEQVLDLFLKRLTRTPPAERTPEGILDHLKKINGAIGEVLKREISEELYVNALQLRLEILGILPQLGDNTAVAARTKLIDEMKRDARPAVKKMAEQLEVEERIGRLPLLDEAAKLAIIEEMGAELAKAPVDNQEEFIQAARNAMSVAQTLEQYGDNKLAAKAYGTYAELLARKNHPELGDTVKQMQATVRRLELPGNSIEINGPTVEGKQFTMEQYKGKVVLVDFWATWCGPCIEELPNVVKLYNDYHAKGFEVIGISLDQDEESLKKFIETRELKWPTIFFPEREDQGWNNPIARHYGISGIPTAILVNQEGKVVSLEARGENLQEELAKLLGPVEPATN